MKAPITALLLITASATAAQGAAATAGDEAGIAPFVAHYLADWKGISIGTSDKVKKPCATVTPKGDSHWLLSASIWIH